MKTIIARGACIGLLLIYAGAAHAQKKPDADTIDLFKQMDTENQQAGKLKTDYTTATFKTTRIINGQSVENLGSGILDVKISHRFGTLNSGGYQLFGLDNATN